MQFYLLCVFREIHQPTYLPYLNLPATQFAITSELIQTTAHQLGTTHQAQRDVAPTCFYQGFPGSWHFFLEGCSTSHHGSKCSLSLIVCLNHTVIQKYLINTELYLTFSKYGDKLLIVKSLTNIVKFAYFNIVGPAVSAGRVL